MREQLYEVMMCGPFGCTYELTLKYPGQVPVTIRTDEASVVFELVFEHVHYHYRNIVHEKIKNLMKEPAYIGFIDELITPFGKIEFRSSKAENTTFYEILVDGERAHSSAYYHTALAEYVNELYTLVELNVSAQIRHLVEWL